MEVCRFLKKTPKKKKSVGQVSGALIRKYVLHTHTTPQLLSSSLLLSYNDIVLMIIRIIIILCILDDYS